MRSLANHGTITTRFIRRGRSRSGSAVLLLGLLFGSVVSMPVGGAAANLSEAPTTTSMQVYVPRESSPDVFLRAYLSSEHPSVEMILSLYKKRSDGTWGRIAGKRVAASTQWGFYQVAFTRPGRGSCKATARFPGDADHAASSASKTFRCANPPSGPRPVMENLGVTFGPWEPATNMAGDFLFTNETPPGDEFNPDFNRVFFEFPNGGWTYHLPVDTDVVAVSDGVVVGVFWQAGEYADGGPNDYEIWVAPPGGDLEQGVERNNEGEIVRGSLRVGTRWMIMYDHVLDIRVKKGDVVRAGDVLGGKQGNLWWSETLGRVEIQGPAEQRITDEPPYQSSWWYCPVSFLEPSVRPQYEAMVTQLMSDWESFKGDPGIYDEENHVAPGCAVERMDGG